jgi:hypothetical protein
MKKIVSILCTASLLAAAILTGSCKPQDGKGDFNNAGGKPYEIVVSADQQLWNGEAGDTLRAILLEPVPMFNQVEPHFDLSRVNPGALKDLILRHRNILIVQVGPQFGEPSSVARYDVYARPQLIVTLTAPDDNSMVRYLSDNRRELLQLFEITERDRAVENNRRYGEKGIDKEIRTLFGIEMNIPRGFSVKGRSGDDFLWVGNDVRTATQGLVLYSYPYAGAEDFQKEHLIARRNEFTGRIPGPSEGSFMATEDYIEPEVEYIRIDGRLWARTSGFWYVENDYMGGPFVNYATVDRASGRVLAADCFVYSPKDPKRNLMRQLEHIVYTVKFPDAQPAR